MLRQVHLKTTNCLEVLTYFKMSDNIERKFNEIRRQLRATRNKKCQFCGFSLVPTTDNNGLICPRCFKIQSPFAFQNSNGDNDDNPPPLIAINAPKISRRSG